MKRREIAALGPTHKQAAAFHRNCRLQKKALLVMEMTNPTEWKDDERCKRYANGDDTPDEPNNADWKCHEKQVRESDPCSQIQGRPQELDNHA